MAVRWAVTASFRIFFAGIFIAMNHQSSLEPEASIFVLLDAVDDLATNNTGSWWNVCYVALLVMAFPILEFAFEGLCVSPVGNVSSRAFGELL